MVLNEMASGGWPGAKIYDALLLRCAAKCPAERMRCIRPAPTDSIVLKRETLLSWVASLLLSTSVWKSRAPATPHFGEEILHFFPRHQYHPNATAAVTLLPPVQGKKSRRVSPPGCVNLPHSLTARTPSLSGVLRQALQ